MFRGRFDHTIDEKGRLALPARHRDLMLERTPEPVVVVTNFDKCLAGYTLVQWEDLERKISALPQFDPTVVSFLRYFVSGASECPVDKAGRILLPSGLREIAGIEKEVLVVGQLTKIEFWSPLRWSAVFGELSEDFVNITSSMAKLGIQL